MKKLIRVVLALACVAAAGRLARAADNGTEFGIEDDLTVLGTGGSDIDPDLEVKGFSVFGATKSALNIPAAPGSMFVRGYVEVSSGMYVAGSSTFTSGAYFTGVSSFSDAANIHIAGGAANQVLKKVAGGGLVWGDDTVGPGEIAGTPRRIVMFQTDGGGGADSLLQQDADDAGITTVGASSMTILGNFQANGAVTLGDAAADLLTVNAQSSFVRGSTFTAGAYFTGVSSFSDVANIHIAGGSINQVLKKVAGGGMAWANDTDTGVTVLGTARRLQMVNDTGDGLIDSTFQQNAADTSITMLATSSMTVLGAFGANGAVTLGNTLAVADNVQLGNAASDIHAINRAVEAGVALSVDSVGTSGNYAAKFYSGGALAAWIKKK